MVEILPQSIAATASALFSPLATITIFLALKMLPIPMVIACLGTSFSLAKNLEFASMVFAVSAVR